MKNRIVTVSSNNHKRGEIHFDDLQGERNYSRSNAYAQSKLANLLFALELDRRLKAAKLPMAQSADIGAQGGSGKFPRS